MNVYTTDKIRNVVLLGHGGAGKTTMVEAMAYLSGITNRMGTVTDGNTISDYDKEEDVYKRQGIQDCRRKILSVWFLLRRHTERCSDRRHYRSGAYKICKTSATVRSGRISDYLYT